MDLALSRVNYYTSAYLELLKPRVMSLAVFTGIVGILLAPNHIEPLNFCLVLFALALGGGAAGAFNMWLERDVDAQMERTKYRPIPSGRISPEHARDFAFLCAAVSVATMAYAANALAASLLAGTILFYAVVYTLWLKPYTPFNIVLGGAAGALPPVIGWAAATGNITLEPIVLFLIIFFWTPPHFWALALVRTEEYSRARIPMLPVVAGSAVTMRHILIYTILLLPVSLLPFTIGMSGLFYLAGAAVFGTVFILHTLKLWHTQDMRYAMPIFLYSIAYLFALFAFLLIDRMFYA